MARHRARMNSRTKIQIRVFGTSFYSTELQAIEDAGILEHCSSQCVLKTIPNIFLRCREARATYVKVSCKR